MQYSLWNLWASRCGRRSIPFGTCGSQGAEVQYSMWNLWASRRGRCSILFGTCGAPCVAAQDVVGAVLVGCGALVTLSNLEGGGCKTGRRSFVCGTCRARGILYIVKFGKSGVQRCNPERVRKKIFLSSFTLIELHVCTPNFFLSSFVPVT